jgi:SPP1 gp7 family putative phage head morphogenesis protein
MAKGKQYWETRFTQLMDSQEKRSDKTAAKIAKEYERTATAIERDISSYYTKYGQDDVVEYRKLVKGLSKAERDMLYQNMEKFAEKYPQHAHLMPVRESIYELNRLEGLQLSVRQNMYELGAIEQREFEKALKQAYERGYLNTMKGLRGREAFFSVNDRVLEQTMNMKWVNGKNFSDRIWENKEKLIETLNREVRDAFIRGEGYSKMQKIIRNRTGVGAYDAKRLIRTEANFLMNQANGQAFQDDGITAYELSAVLDDNTSDICEELDGEQFEFEEAKVGENFPPMHPFCRTMIMPVERTGR